VPERTGPSFLVVGAARAGSTAVTEALRAHPDAFVTSPKEPHYFAFAGQAPGFTGPGDDETINVMAVTELENYLSLFPADRRAAVAGEGSVSTLYYHEVSVARVKAMNPDMRIVVVLREPVARAFSAFQYLTVRGYETESDFLVAVADEQRRRGAGWHHLWHYTSMSRYAQAVAHFVEEFDGAVGVWFHDDLEREPQRILAEIQEFVGLDPSRAMQEQPQRVNASGRPRQPVVQKAMAWAGSRPHLRQGVKAVVPFSLRERIRSANLQPTAASAEAVRALAPTFANDLTALEEVLGRPLPEGWVRP